MTSQVWTTERPTVRGYYWAAYGDGEVVFVEIEMSEYSGPSAYFVADEAGHSLDGFSHFMGPLSIVKPEPPQ